MALASDSLVTHDLIVVVRGEPPPPRLAIMASTCLRCASGILANWSGVSCGMAGMAGIPEISSVVAFSQRPGLASNGLISWAVRAARGHNRAMPNKIDVFTDSVLP